MNRQRQNIDNRSAPELSLDMENPLNWTVAQLREKLMTMGINAPRNFNAATLRQLYHENIGRHAPLQNEDDQPQREMQPTVNLGGSDVTTTNENNGALLQTLQTMAESCAALQKTVNTLLEKDKA